MSVTSCSPWRLYLKKYSQPPPTKENIMETTSHTPHSTSSAPQGVFARGQHMLEGMHMQFPQFKHEHHGPIVNVNEVVDNQLTMGQRIADSVATTVGSWPFIIIQSCVLALWLIVNSLAWINHWDPYPFILLNLALSFQAAYSAPFVMMSQNRQATKDRLTAENDYKTDVKGEHRIEALQRKLAAIETNKLDRIIEILEKNSPAASTPGQPI